MSPTTSFRRRARLASLALVLLGAGCGGSADEPRETTETKQAPMPPAPDVPWPVAFELPEGITPRFERVVLVTLDTLRADHLASYGYARQTSPFFDRLAGDGMLFTRAVASSSHTAPSHTSMLTGLPPAMHGVLKNGLALDESAADLARLFGAAGFETAAFLSVRFLAEICGSFDKVDVRVRRGGPVADAAIRWLERERASERFFLWVHLYDPHRWKEPTATPRSELATILKAEERDRDARYAYLRELQGLPDLQPGQAFASLEDSEESEALDRDAFLDLMDGYDAQILYTDRQLERVYEALEALELPGSTLWIITADHGEGLGSHGVAGHGARLYQEQLHVPFVVHASDGSLETGESDALVQHVDLFPTLAETLGARVTGLDPELDGVSLCPLLAGEAGWQDRPAFAQRRPMNKIGMYALQTERWKYILVEPGDDELYDLEADPLELENLVEEPSKERDALRSLLEARLERFERSARPESSEELSPEILEELRALGYVR